MCKASLKNTEFAKNEAIKKQRSRLLKASATASLALIMFAFVAISWFTSNKEVDTSNMTIMVKDTSINCVTTSYHYIRTNGNAYAGQVGTIDDAFELMQYDSLFTGNNNYTYAVERLELTSADLPESGTLYFDIEREPSQTSDMIGSDYISSVTYYAFVTLPTFPTLPNDILTAVHNAATAQNTVKKTFVVNEEKVGSISFGVPYTAENWSDGKLYIYLYTDYEETLITDYIDKSLRNLLQNNGGSGHEDQVDVEYGTDVTMLNDIKRIVISRQP
jgi:hypothetical protein